MPELLLEVGCEELPATFVRKAYTDLHDRIGAALGDLYGGAYAGIALGTPRRLIVAFADVPERQPDSTKEVRGPSLKAAFDGEGKPTQALLGFCRSNGAEPTDLRRDEQYVWLTKATPGLPTRQLLAEVLPKAIKGLTFEKSMRWGSGRLRFARPVRWLLAAFGGDAIEFEIEGVRSGVESRGHRFYAPEPFAATTLEVLLTELRARKVEPELARRAAAIREQAGLVANGSPDLPDDLVDENAFLTEWPTAITGAFRAEHLSLPGAVLTTAMAKHEKMFPVRDSNGSLVSQFVFIRNSGEDDAVRTGAEWVLNARLDDAQFFFREDAKHDLDHFLEKTSGIVFQERLGTIRERADRLEALSGFVADRTGASPDEVSFARLAGRLGKADLSTGLVSDMASLQGIVGGEYGRREGLPEPVCEAIAGHYDPSKNMNPDDPAARTSQRLAIADNLDKLAGFLGLGLVPSGSSDPFGLRRSATILIEIAWNWRAADIDYAAWIAEAAGLYMVQEKPIEPERISSAMADLFVGRYDAMLPNVRHDILDAAVAGTHAWNKPGGLPTRIATLELLAQNVAFVQTATRPLNIVSAAVKKGIEPSGDLSRLESAEGDALAALLRGADQSIEYALSCGDAVAAERELVKLQAPINMFMDRTMIMVEDEPVRASRLGLLDAVGQILMRVGDFTKLVAE